MAETKKIADAVETPAAKKSAADILIEMQLEEKRKASANPMVIVSEEFIDAERIEGKGVVVHRKVFADGAVLENYA